MVPVRAWVRLYVENVLTVTLHSSTYHDNHHTKLEDPWAMSSLVIDQAKFVYGPTDRPTDRHVQSNIPPLLRRGHNNDRGSLFYGGHITTLHRRCTHTL